MEEDQVLPADCSTMLEVRQGVDRLDERIVELLAERFRYMEAAARIKPNREAVRDEERKSQVIDNVRRIAERENAPAGAIALLYELLVETSIDYEFKRYDLIRG